MKELTIVETVKEFKLSSSASLKVTKQSQRFDLNLDGKVETFLINYNYYEAYQGDGQKSGAYIFRPATPNASPKKFSTIKAIHYADGDGVLVIILEGDKTYSILTFSKSHGYVNDYGFEL